MDLHESNTNELFEIIIPSIEKTKPCWYVIFALSNMLLEVENS